ncbi:putative SnoaL-like aldol condensation-catalyzing enzyme [Sphingobium sp. B1D7B]|uniref:nuclear transport factor 2 family protein n=1 Tax=unclassified Sphingobium TaxID=2611147 RepID=UPI0022259B6C|nr:MULTISPECIES: nuclear transport factor 2 family protein [unclassified Sphingobium]MCW2392814.1 putative SnoaL-like aldol condensation-catalyzing enzyme [Sphingobium sp. B11D3A]MCW2404548.1 putative SnoaL-like aldol condensation-catalyzing enzyme [Sphingobium sp. B1D7B]
MISILLATALAMAPDSTPAVTPPSSQEAPAAAPSVPTDHAALLASKDPKLARNKRLVYDMYRIVLVAGQVDRAHEFIAKDYIQHNPNAAQGLAGVMDYVRSSRPQRPVEAKLSLPMVDITAERDKVVIAFVRPEKDANGQTYYTTWFDMFRIENGKIAEHWDPMLKGEPKVDPNQKKL